MKLSMRISDAKQQKRLIVRAIICILVLILPSCQIPKLRKADPGPGVPSEFNVQSSPGVTNPGATNPATNAPESSAQLSVEEFYNDPMLVGLIRQGLANNRELQILNQEVLVAQSEVLSRQGAYLPFISLGVDSGIEKPSRYTFNGAVESELPILPGQPFPNPLANYRLGLNVFWRLDIWRALRNARDAAKQRLIAAVDKRNFFVTRLVADIAENYYSLMALDTRLVNIDQTIAIQEDSLQAAQSFFQQAR